MKKSQKIGIFLLFILSNSKFALADVVGVSSKAALLQQLQIGLEIRLKDYDLPTYLTSKLPAGTSPELITSTFLSAWTQLTFSVCQQAIAKGQVPPNLSSQGPIEKWLIKIASRSWYRPSQSTDIQAAYDAGFNSANSNLPQSTRLALSCSFVFSSPNVYTILAN